MRTFRAMSITTMVLLTLMGILSWHLSWWMLDQWSLQGSLFATLCIFAGLGVIAAVVTLVLGMQERSFGTPVFLSELVLIFGSIALLITTMLLFFGWMAFDLFESPEDRPFDVVQYLSVALGFLGAYTLSFFSLVIIHGSDSWTGEAENGQVINIEDRRTG